jgi:hypothetical protein
MVLSIGVGVGVNVAAHSVLRRLLVEPPVAADSPDRLFTISPSVSYRQYEDLKARETRSALAASQAATLIWHDQSATTTVGAQVVSRNYFEVLQTRPLMGRTFTDGENDPLRVVVTYAFWERSLHRDPGVLGRTLTINGWPFVIAAVLPRAFYSTVGPMATPLLYVPISPHINAGLEDRAAPQFDLFGRLHDTATPEQAASAPRRCLACVEGRASGTDHRTSCGLAFRLFDFELSLQAAGRVVDMSRRQRPKQDDQPLLLIPVVSTRATPILIRASSAHAQRHADHAFRTGVRRWVPSLDLVVVLTGGNYNAARSPATEIMAKELLPAFLSRTAASK